MNKLVDWALIVFVCVVVGYLAARIEQASRHQQTCPPRQGHELLSQTVFSDGSYECRYQVAVPGQVVYR